VVGRCNASQDAQDAWDAGDASLASGRIADGSDAGSVFADVIPVGEGSCYYNWLSTFSPGVVVEGATSASFFPLSFFNYLFGNSFMSFLPVGMLILRIITVSFRSCCPWRFPSGGIILPTFVIFLFLEFCVESFF